MSDTFFASIEPIRYAGPDSDDPLAFRWYDADRVVLGRTMREHLRFAACYWHSFNWNGFDIFGDGTLDRPWLAPGREPLAAAEEKMAAAFEFFEKLTVPFWCFHDHDIAPEGATFAESVSQPRPHGRTSPPSTRPGPVSSCCGAPRSCSPTAATWPARPPTPTPRSSPTRPVRSRTAWT